MLNRFIRAILALGLSAMALVGVDALAFASSSVMPASLGYDISYPQCGGTPPTAGFGIVGVNDGHPFSTNPCLASEIRWAQSTLSGAPSFYMNTASPGPAYTSGWPTSQLTPKTCLGANSPACSYDYGWNAARVSFANAVNAETQIGSNTPTAAARQAHWWLDVETGNQWETIEPGYGRTVASGAVDQAVLHGSLDYFASIGVGAVGIYSTSQQWQVITVNAGSAFSPTPVWLPGYATLAEAQAACTGPSFTGGRVAMIQFPSNGLDGDYICGLVSTPSADTVAVPGSATFNVQLAVSGNSSPVSYVQTSGTPALVVSATGLVTTSGTLSAGSYTASGTMTDANGDKGAFTFSLSVGAITQIAPTSQMVKTSQSAAFSAQLAVTGNAGPVTYVATTVTPGLVVSPAGVVTTSGTLAAGTYNATGSTSDGLGDTGTFQYSLIVGTITQNAPLTNTVLTTALTTFTDQISVSRNTGPVTFVQSTGAPNLVVGPSGLVTPGSTLTPATYKVTGTTSDAFGDVGTFAYALKVTTAQAVALASGPHPTNVIGHAVAGRSVVLAITGSGFFGRPTVTSHAGTSALVIKDTGNLLLVRVSVRSGSPNGVFTFTVRLANGRSGRVKYNQH